MANRTDDADSKYNGSAAYDIYTLGQQSFEGTAAPEIQHPGLPEERPLPQRQQRVKAKTQVAPMAVLGMMVVACMLILVVFGYVQLYEATERVSSLESSLAVLEKDQIVLESLYEGSIDLEAMETRASELGFAAPEEEQVVYLNLTGTDTAEIYHTEKLSFLERVLQAIKSSASGLVEYLS